MAGSATVLRLVAALGLAIGVLVGGGSAGLAQIDPAQIYQLTVYVRICPSATGLLSAETCVTPAQGAVLIVTESAGGTLLGNLVTNEAGAVTVDVPANASVVVTLDGATSSPNSQAAANPIAVGPIGADTSVYFFLVPTAVPSPSPSPSPPPEPPPSAAPSPSPPPVVPTTASISLTRVQCQTSAASSTEFLMGSASPGGCSASANATLTLMAQDGEAQDAQATNGDGWLVFAAVPLGTYTIVDDATDAWQSVALTAAGASFTVVRYVTVAAGMSPPPSAAPSMAPSPSPAASSAPSASPSARPSSSPGAASAASSARASTIVVTRLPSTGNDAATTAQEGRTALLIAGAGFLVIVSLATGRRRLAREER